MVEACGYTYNPPPDVVPNSLKALEVTELARDLGLHERVHTRLMDAYWSEGANIGDEETLLGLAAEVGLDRDEATAALADGRYRARIAQSTREANMAGIDAIPAFVLAVSRGAAHSRRAEGPNAEDQGRHEPARNRLLLVGAYPHEVFERALAQLEERAS